jgi:hypothetical protein
MDCFAQSGGRQLLKGYHNGTSWGTWTNLGGDVSGEPHCNRSSTGFDCYWADEHIQARAPAAERDDVAGPGGPGRDGAAEARLPARERRDPDRLHGARDGQHPAATVLLLTDRDRRGASPGKRRLRHLRRHCPGSPLMPVTAPVTQAACPRPPPLHPSPPTLH